jgi:ribonucleotide monophosphatase NagD (HAD superfamily)
MTKSQKQRLVKFFKSGKDITETQANHRFGIGNLSARIAELRAEGYSIYTNTLKTQKGETTVYRLGKPNRTMVAAAYKALGSKAFA